MRNHTYTNPKRPVGAFPSWSDPPSPTSPKRCRNILNALKCRTRVDDAPLCCPKRRILPMLPEEYEDEFRDSSPILPEVDEDQFRDMSPLTQPLADRQATVRDSVDRTIDLLVRNTLIFQDQESALISACSDISPGAYRQPAFSRTVDSLVLCSLVVQEEDSVLISACSNIAPSFYRQTAVDRTIDSLIRSSPIVVKDKDLLLIRSCSFVPAMKNSPYWNIQPSYADEMELSSNSWESEIVQPLEVRRRQPQDEPDPIAPGMELFNYDWESDLAQPLEVRMRQLEDEPDLITPGMELFGYDWESDLAQPLEVRMRQLEDKPNPSPPYLPQNELDNVEERRAKSELRLIMSGLVDVSRWNETDPHQGQQSMQDIMENAKKRRARLEYIPSGAVDNLMYKLSKYLPREEAWAKSHSVIPPTRLNALNSSTIHSRGEVRPEVTFPATRLETLTSSLIDSTTPTATSPDRGLTPSIMPSVSSHTLTTRAFFWRSYPKQTTQLPPSPKRNKPQPRVILNPPRDLFESASCSSSTVVLAPSRDPLKQAALEMSYSIPPPVSSTEALHLSYVKELSSEPRKPMSPVRKRIATRAARRRFEKSFQGEIDKFPDIPARATAYADHAMWATITSDTTEGS